MTLADLETLHQERELAVADYLDACRSFDLRRARAATWLMSYIRLNAFIGLGFDIHKVTEGLLEEVLAQRKIVEPYYSQIRAAQLELGETESSRCTRSLNRLVEEASGNDNLIEALGVARDLQNDAPLRTADCVSFHGRLESHAYSYKVTPIAEIDLAGCTAVLAVVMEILRRVEAGRPTLVSPDKRLADTSVEFFPFDPNLKGIHRLALAAEKARQDAHHLRVRGHWLIRGKLERLAEFLVMEGTIGRVAEVFEQSPAWLLQQVSQFENKRM